MTTTTTTTTTMMMMMMILLVSVPLELLHENHLSYIQKLQPQRLPLQPIKIQPPRIIISTDICGPVTTHQSPWVTPSGSDLHLMIFGVATLIGST